MALRTTRRSLTSERSTAGAHVTALLCFGFGRRGSRPLRTRRRAPRLTSPAESNGTSTSRTSRRPWLTAWRRSTRPCAINPKNRNGFSHEKAQKAQNERLRLVDLTGETFRFWEPPNRFLLCLLCLFAAIHSR